MKVIITGTTGYVGEGVMLACLDNPEIEKVRERGNIGIPCFVKEDGSVLISLKHYDESMAAVTEQEYTAGAACNLDGIGC